MKKLPLFLIFLFFPFLAHAATYYIATNGSNSNNGTSTATAWATFTYAFTQMSAGDTLIVRDGTYAQQILNPPSGSAGNYTTIQAENNFRVTVRLPAGSSNGALRSTTSYYQIEGIKFDGNGVGQGGTLIGGNHIKLIRCAFTGAPTSSYNHSAFSTTSSSYVLLEECWSWGTGRYKFIAYQSNHIIFRRCVARHDYHPSTQCAPFVRYESPYTDFQNCIAIDSATGAGSGPGTLYAGIWNENNGGVVTTGKDLGCIILNVQAKGINDYKLSGTRTITNCAVVNTQGGMRLGNYNNLVGTFNLAHNTIVNVVGTGGNGNGAGVFGERYTGTLAINVIDSLIQGCSVLGVENGNANPIASVSYLNLFDNTANIEGGISSSNIITDDPALLYLTRIETGAPGDGTASDSGDIGATIINRYGTDGTLWGDAGYEDLTATALWPFPNEAEIQADFRTYNDFGINGNRGFCAAGQTLSNYIWGYLGNQYDWGEPPPDPPPPPIEYMDTYYISPTGSDANNGTEMAPWLTLQYAANNATAGETFIVQPGTYTGFNQWDGGLHDGNATDPITFRANGTVVLNQENADTTDIINIENNDYWVIDGFTCENATRAGIRVVNSTSTIIKNNDCNNNGVWGIFTGFSPSILIENNTASYSGEQHGIYVSNSYTSPERPIVRRNTVYNNTQAGIQLNGDPESGGDGIIEDAIVEENRIYYNGWQGISYISSCNGTIKNNIIYDNGQLSSASGGIHIVEETGTDGYSLNNTIVQNTIYEPNMNNAVQTEANNTGNVIFNNILVSALAGIEFNGATNYESNNINSTNFTGVVNSYADKDFDLPAGSSAIDAGTDTYQGKVAPGVDIEGRIRPYGVTFDMGAYESTDNTTAVPVDYNRQISGKVSFFGKVQ